jgi:2-amino-4-hydroxy-6-hydroxymethyldihydropteridine diphosphokinase
MPTAYIGLGANISGPAGTPEATLARAAEQVAALGRVAARSHLYSTAPVGLAEQPRFLNATLALETELAPRALLEGLLAIERGLGRDRSNSVPNGPRALDLDLLLFDELVLSEHGLAVPHPRMAERAFVLAPLSEIAPQARDPRTGATVGELFERLCRESAAENGPDAVVRVESDLWRAGAGDGGGGSDDLAADADSDRDCDKG